MSFPIIALILLSDIIFGMIMKAHPQFNLLAIGFPVKPVVLPIGALTSFLGAPIFLYLIMKRGIKS